MAHRGQVSRCDPGVGIIDGTPVFGLLRLPMCVGSRGRARRFVCTYQSCDPLMPDTLICCHSMDQTRSQPNHGEDDQVSCTDRARSTYARPTQSHQPLRLFASVTDGQRAPGHGPRAWKWPSSWSRHREETASIHWPGTHPRCDRRSSIHGWKSSRGRRVIRSPSTTLDHIPRRAALDASASRERGIMRL